MKRKYRNERNIQEIAKEDVKVTTNVRRHDAISYMLTVAFPAGPLNRRSRAERVGERVLRLGRVYFGA